MPNISVTFAHIYTFFKPLNLPMYIEKYRPLFQNLEWEDVSIFFFLNLSESWEAKCVSMCVAFFLRRNIEEALGEKASQVNLSGLKFLSVTVTAA